MANLIDAGNKNLINVDKIIYAVKLPKNLKESKISHRIEIAKNEGKLLKVTHKFKARSAIIMENGWVVISPFTAQMIAQKIERKLEIKCWK